MLVQKLAFKICKNGNVYDFSVDYWPISTYQIHDIHRYLMKKTILYKMLKVIKKC